MISNRNRRLSVSAILFFTLCLLSRSVSATATEDAPNKHDLYSFAHIDSFKTIYLRQGQS